MVATAKQESQDTIQSVNICQQIEIDAPLEIAFEAVLTELGPGSELPDGTPFPMKIEAWPGGRWYRDLGDNVGHFWGHVQVIKPPKLLELSGPMMMSYPGVNFVQYRLEPTDNGGTRLTLTHRAFGNIPAEHRDGFPEGWGHGIKRISELAVRMAVDRR
jgi:Activator of Hsp90 ATPase homolog 1-like protein